MESPESPSPRRARGRPRGWDDKTAQNTIKSLDRAIMVLQRLGEMGSATLSELSSDLDQSPATVYRVLVTLQGRDLAEFTEDGQVWQIGAGAFLIGSRFLRRTSLVERARPVLRALMATTGETANLGVAKGAEVLFVSQVETQSNIRAFFPPGSVSDMHASGIGKALLAFMAPDQRDAVLGDRALTAYTAHTLTARDALARDLADTRARGYAVDRDEKTDGMRCIAAPVFDASDEVVAGISVSGPSGRLGDGDIAGLARAVTDAARDLSVALGAKG